MKKIYVIIIGLALLAGSCSDFTEIDPKGKNVLNRVEDLDLLLNYEYYLSVSNKQVVLINDFYPSLVNIPNLLTESIRTLNGAYVSWDENANRTELVETDNTYTELYSIIGKVANPVLLNVDAASGDRTMANRLKAEALVLRGWFHYLLVNIYAKAYNPATAATDPGIVYALETDAVETPNEKLSVEQVYELILADINAALELSSLPISPAGMRVGLPFAYAVKAKVLMSMRDYDGAFEAAGESLKLKSTIDDYSNLLQPENLMGTGTMEFTRPYLTLEEELLESPCYLMLETMTPELWNMFEEGHILKDYLLTDQKLFGMPTMGMTYLGLNVPCLYAMNTYYSPLGLTTVDMYLTQAECYIREGKGADIQVVIDGRNSTTAQLAAGYVTEIVRTVSASIAGVESPVKTRFLFNPNLITQWFIMPGLIVMLSMLQVVVLSALSVAREREQGTFEQLLVSPYTTLELLTAKSIVPILIGLFQSTLIFLVDLFWFDIPMGGSVIAMYAVLFLFTLSVVGLGLAISAYSQTMQQGLLIVFVFLVPMVLLSGLFAPVENMPEWIQVLTYADPLRFTLAAVRQIYLAGASFLTVLPTMSAPFFLASARRMSILIEA